MWGATEIVIGNDCASAISIHAPRVGSDCKAELLPSCRHNFNPRSPCGERPSSTGNPAPTVAISIHAPRVGSDRCYVRHFPLSVHYFNPRSPCGERHFNPRSPCGERRFQSTLPVWGATITSSIWFSPAQLISIHAPRVGSDVTVHLRVGALRYFNPRSPCGERPRAFPC